MRSTFKGQYFVGVNQKTIIVFHVMGIYNQVRFLLDQNITEAGIGNSNATLLNKEIQEMSNILEKIHHEISSNEISSVEKTCSEVMSQYSVSDSGGATVRLNMIVHDISGEIY